MLSYYKFSENFIVKRWLVIYKVRFYKIIMCFSYQNLPIIIIRLNFEEYFQIYRWRCH